MAVCVSYPKSGRTWLRMMLAELNVSMEFTHLDTGTDKAAWGKHLRNINIPSTDAETVIFLHRDPRDTVVSFFYEVTIRQKPRRERAIKRWLQGRSAPKEIDAFVRSKQFGIEKTMIFNLLCAEHLDALPIAYEEMRWNPEGVLSSILKHIGQLASEDQIHEVVENNSFERMRAREAGNEYTARQLRARDTSNPNSYKVRRGKIGGWMDELKPETQDFVNRMLERYEYFCRMEELLKKKRPNSIRSARSRHI